MNNTTEIQNSLFETMKVFSNYNSKPGTVTIECKIIEVIDIGLGKYKVDYLGNKFDVYSNNNTLSYEVDDNVYVLVPDNDFGKNKIIIGSVNPTTRLFVDAEMGSSLYEEVSDNLIIFDEDDEIQMNSLTGDIKGSIEFNSDIKDLLSNYFKDYRTFKLSADFRTEIPLARQKSGGNYGLRINIPVLISSGATPIESIKTYQIDVGNMVGTPYSFEEWIAQEFYFTLEDNCTFDKKRDISAEVFCYDFPNSGDDLYDIFIRNVNFQIMDTLSGDSTSGYCLTLKASQGQYFTTNIREPKTITPTLRVNGKKTSLGYGAEVYWFEEDVLVNASSKNYLTYGGNGWACLNEKTNFSYTDEGTETFDYVTDVEELVVEREDSYREYKCVVIYNKVAVSAIIKLKDISTEIQPFTLSTIGGHTTYQKNAGVVQILTSVNIDGVTNSEENKNRVTYSFARYDKKGKLINDNENFFNPVQVNVKREEVDIFDSVFIYPVYEIDEVNTIKCTVRLDGEPRFSGSLTVTTDENLKYRLVVNNADKLYKYDTDGNSPASSAYNGPLESRISAIPALSFNLYHLDGSELTEEEYKYVKYDWAVPNNSMISAVKMAAGVDEGDYTHYSGYKTEASTANLSYSIASRFSMNKSNNTIILTVEYGDVTITQNIVLSFLKEGQNGTNGTSYSSVFTFGIGASGEKKEVGSIQYDKIYKMRFVKHNNRLYYYNYLNSNFEYVAAEDNFPYTLGIRFWNNGEESTDYKVSYSILNNNEENYIYRNDSGQIKIKPNGKIVPIIIQAEVTPQNQGKDISNQTIYCYSAIEITEYNNLEIENGKTINDYFVPAIEGGFTEVMYASDGTNPKWNEDTDFSFDGFNAYPQEYKDYLTIEWDAPNTVNNGPKLYKITVDKEDIGKATVKPYNKYVADIATFDRNEITAQIKVTDNIAEVKSNKENKIAENESAIGKTNDILSCLNEIAKAFTPSAWVASLSDVLAEKNRLIKLLDEVTSAYLIMNTGNDNSTFNAQIDGIKNNIKNIGYDGGNAITDISGFIFPPEGSSYVINDGGDYDFKIGEYNAAVKSLTSLTLENFYSTIELIVGDEDISFKKKLEKLEELNYGKYVDYIIAEMDKLKDNPSPVNANEIITGFYNGLFSNIFIKSDAGYFVRDNIRQELDNRNKELEEDNKKLNDDIDVINRMTSLNNKVLIKHHRPIVMYFNRYEMSNINGWDGNNVKVTDGYILTPQIGAGMKNNDNSFTGVVMGLKNKGLNNIRKGLFGYSKGVQSFVLDAENGAAIFGKADTANQKGSGQIIIDPTQSEAMIYSSGYFNPNNFDSSSGLPMNYNAQSSGNGTMINLTDGLIHFGSSGGKLYSGSHSGLDSRENGFYLSHNGLSIGDGFKANSAGRLEVGNLSGSHWTISGDSSASYISYGNKGSSGSVYIGTDEIKLGSKATITNTGKATFNELYASNSGTIGGWTIGSSTLKGGATTLNSDGTITCNKLVANTDGKIGGWDITPGILKSGQIELNGLSGTLLGDGWRLSNGEFTLGGITYRGGNTNASLGDFSASTGFGLTGNAKTQFDTLVASKVETDFLKLAGRDVEWRTKIFLNDIAVILDTEDEEVMSPSGGTKKIKVPKGIRVSTVKDGIVYLGKPGGVVS